MRKVYTQVFETRRITIIYDSEAELPDNKAVIAELRGEGYVIQDVHQLKDGYMITAERNQSRRFPGIVMSVWSEPE
jgi:hypothetical protein